MSGDCVAPVVSLLHGRLPSTVLRRVRAVIVDPSERVAGSGLGSHRCVEGREVSQPLGANGDAPAAPVWVPRVCRVETPLLHCRPRTVLRRLCLPMPPLPGGGLLSVQATAGCAKPPSKARSRDDLFGSAGTPAEPLGAVPAVVRATPDNGEGSECCAGHFDESGHAQSIPRHAKGSTSARKEHHHVP